MASLDARKVLQVRSVELAMVKTHPPPQKVKSYVRSSFDDRRPSAGHAYLRRGWNSWTGGSSTGIAFSSDEAQINLRDVATSPGVAAADLVPWPKPNINVDMIIKVVSDDTTTTDITPSRFARRRVKRRDEASSRKKRRARSATASAHGRGVRGGRSRDRSRHALAFPAVAARAFNALAGEGRQHPRHNQFGDQVLDDDRRRLYELAVAHASHSPLRLGAK